MRGTSSSSVWTCTRAAVRGRTRGSPIRTCAGWVRGDSGEGAQDHGEPVGVIFHHQGECGASGRCLTIRICDTEVRVVTVLGMGGGARPRGAWVACLAHLSSPPTAWLSSPCLLYLCESREREYCGFLLFACFLVSFLLHVYLGHTQQCSRLTPGAALGSYSWWCSGTICGARDGTWAGLVQGRCPPLCPVASVVPLFCFVLFFSLSCRGRVHAPPRLPHVLSFLSPVAQVVPTVPVPPLTCLRFRGQDQADPEVCV